MTYAQETTVGGGARTKKYVMDCVTHRKIQCYPRHQSCSPRHHVPQDIGQMHPRYNDILGTCLGCSFDIMGYILMSWVHVLGEMPNVPKTSLMSWVHFDILGNIMMSWVHFANCSPRYDNCSPRHVYPRCLGNMHIVGANLMSWGAE